MADNDKISGSGPAHGGDAGPSSGTAEPSTRRFPNAAAADGTIFQPLVRRAGPRRSVGPAADTAARPRAKVAMPPRRAAQQATDLSVTHDNPLMQAASPLLLLFGRLRTSLVRTQVSTLVPQIILAVGSVEKEAIAAGVKPAIAERAKYCLCVAADEVVGNLPDSDGSATDSGIARHFFGGRLRGDNFLDSLAAGANDDRDLLELQHACLALVFAGSSRVVGADATRLQRVRDDLYQRMQKSGAAVRKALSPRWQGLTLPAPGTRLQIPFWAITGIIGMALFALYLTVRTLLGLQAESVAQSLRQLTPPSPITARSDVGTPPTPLPPTPSQVTQLERIRKVLAGNIAAGSLSVEPTANQIVIRIPDRVIFQPERATVGDDFAAIALRIALAIDKEQGPIKVIGHTDDTAPTSGRYVSNFQLSLERAKAVAALIRRSLTQPDRVSAEGKGADAPIAPNNTADGRAKNRRIDIVIPRSD
jgi:type VI secretion system protein ImpK